MMKASIIVPTFGTRPAYLTDALGTAVEQRFPKDQYEILVIDNNPEIDVRPIVESFNRAHTEGPVVQYFKAPEIGASEARNSGAQIAKSGILIFIGDDVLLNPDWIAAIIKPFSDPKVACVGGKLIPKWEAPIPEWFSQLKHMALGMLDLGSETLELKGQMVWGDNMAVRKTVFLELGGFPPDIYGYGDKRYLWYGGDGECGLETKIYKHKYKIVYEPRAWVHHRIPASRTVKEYFYKRALVLAIASSFSEIRGMGTKRFLSVRLVLRSGFYFLKSVGQFLKSALGRHNRVRSRVFSNKYYGMANHQFRVAFSRSLQQNIFRESYLK